MPALEQHCITATLSFPSLQLFKRLHNEKSGACEQPRTTRMVSELSSQHQPRTRSFQRGLQAAVSWGLAPRTEIAQALLELEQATSNHIAA